MISLHIIDNNRSLHDDLFNDQCINDEAKKFRVDFEKIVSKSRASGIWELLKKVKANKGYKSKTNGSSKIIGKQLPQADLNLSDVNSFFDKILFAVNQSNETDLHEFIKISLSNIFESVGSNFGSSEINAVYNETFVKMLDWLKEREGTFIKLNSAWTYFEKYL